MLQENNPGGIWIGATDQEEEGNWRWTDCSSWSFTNWGMRNGTQQPDNSVRQDGAGQNCALFSGNNSVHTGWNDVPCNIREQHFVCAKPICSNSGEICCKNDLILNCLFSGSTLPYTLIIVAASSVSVIFCAAVVAFLIARHLKIKRKPLVERRDENPVYQMYYFADGQHVDYGTSEVQDENQYYGT